MIEAIVLAAGKAERFGATKPLVDVDGAPSLERVLGSLRAAGIERIIVVLGHDADRIEAAVDLRGCRVVRNPNYETGMASSLRAGLQAVSSEAEGALVIHADMPYVSSETVTAVVARARAGARIAAPRVSARRGFPVYLRADTFGEVLPTLRGETGARAYLAAHAEELVLVDVRDSGAVRDIDRPADLARGRA